MPSKSIDLPKFNNPFEFDMLMLEPVHKMSATGIRIDQGKKKELQDKAVATWYELQEKLDTIVGSHLNVESKSGPRSVPAFLYGELELPKRTKNKKLTADEDALRSLMAECNSKVKTLKTESAKYKWKRGYLSCYYILKVRGIRKQISSYLGLKIDKGKLAGPSFFEDTDGRVRSQVAVSGTKSARFTHKKTSWGTGLNLGTVPPEVKSMYIADDGYELGEVDLNRGESWVYAHLSEDPELLRIHLNNLDFHSITASAISIAFGEPLTEEWIIEHKNGKAYKIRYVGKKTNHATAYRMGPNTGAEAINEEAETTGITVVPKQVRIAQDVWHEKYYMVKNGWWPEIERAIESTRTLYTPYGRRLTFHDQYSQKLLREATAYVPQSTSVDYLNRGFFKVYYQYEQYNKWELRVLAQTHDSLLFQYRKKFRDDVMQHMVEALTSTLTIKGRTFSIPVEAGYGNSWGEMEEYPL